MNRRRVASELVKLAGRLLGPGVPDGTGPVGLGRRQRRRWMPCPITEVVEAPIAEDEEELVELEPVQVASELVKIAKELLAAKTFPCPICGTKVLEQTKYCVKCKKKVEPKGK